MRTIISIAAVVLLFLACSKEEDIPFIAADTDTISPIYYHKLGGHYKGYLREIEFVSPTSYVVLSTKAYEIDVVETDFNYIAIDNISNRVESNATSEVYRYNDLAYLHFLESSLQSGLEIDTVYLDYFNGLFVKGAKSIEYFIKSRDKIDTTVFHHEYFEGIRD